MADYIAFTDIRDRKMQEHMNANVFDVNQYLSMVNDEINDLAEELGVRDTTDIETSPLHYKIKRYAIYTFTRFVCEDMIGFNQLSLAEQDGYRVKLEITNQRLEDLKPQITVSMMTGDVNEVADRGVESVRLFRV